MSDSMLLNTVSNKCSSNKFEKEKETLIVTGSVKERITMFDSKATSYGRSQSVMDDKQLKKITNKSLNKRRTSDYENVHIQRLPTIQPHFKNADSDKKKSAPTIRFEKNKRNTLQKHDKLKYLSKNDKIDNIPDRFKSKKLVRKPSRHSSNYKHEISHCTLPKKSQSLLDKKQHEKIKYPNRSESIAAFELIERYENLKKSAETTVQSLNRFLQIFNDPKVVNLVKTTASISDYPDSSSENSVSFIDDVQDDDRKPYVEKLRKDILLDIEPNKNELQEIDNILDKINKMSEEVTTKIDEKCSSHEEINNKNCETGDQLLNNHDEDTTESFKIVGYEDDEVFDDDGVFEDYEAFDDDEVFIDDFGYRSLNSSRSFVVEAYNKDGDVLFITEVVTTGNILEVAVDEDKCLANGEKKSLPMRHGELNNEGKYTKKETVYDLNSNPRIEKISCLDYAVDEHNDDNCLVNNDLLLTLSSPNKLGNKIGYIIQELIDTEGHYVNSLQNVVVNYIPFLTNERLISQPTLIGKQKHLFGNIEDLFKLSKKFFRELNNCNKSYEDIAEVFIKHQNMFKLYPKYTKNKPCADENYNYFKPLIETRQKMLQQRLDLASYLLTPIQRLGKYKLLLENIVKELQKENISSESVNQALSIIKTAMTRGNDYIAIDSIKKCPVNLLGEGSFIIRENFNMIKPSGRKTEVTIFLFSEIIVFTTVDTRKVNYFNYISSIKMTDLTIVTYENNGLIFQLIDYTKSKRENNQSYIYILEARSEKMKQMFTKAIEKRLWEQLTSVKEKLRETHKKQGIKCNCLETPKGQQGKRRLRKTVSLKTERNRTMSQSKFYV